MTIASKEPNIERDITLNIPKIIEIIRTPIISRTTRPCHSITEIKNNSQVLQKEEEPKIMRQDVCQMKRRRLSSQIGMNL